MAAQLLQDFAVPLTLAEEGEVAAAASDFRYLLAEYEVHSRIQLQLFRAGYKQMNTFAVMADDRAGLRTAISNDIINPAENGLTAVQVAAARLSVTQLIAAWMAASQRAAETTRLSADAKALRLPTLLSRPALIGYRQRFEAAHGRVPDAIWPCAALIETMMDECEEGSCSAVSLTEVISEEMSIDEQIVLQEAGTNIRVRKAPKKIPLPNTTEEFRQRIRTLAIAYTLLSYKHSARPWIRTATLDVWAGYVEYVLGDRVAGYKLDESGLAVRASWTTVLSYEHAMRKLVCRLILYENNDFATALRAAQEDLSCKEQFYITPTAMLMAGGKRGTQQQPQQVAQYQGGTGGGSSQSQGNQGSRQKNAVRKSGKDQNKSNSTGKQSGNQPKKSKAKNYRGKKTLDGRMICDFYNGARGCNKDKCNFVHVCAFCFADHSAFSGLCK